MLIDQLNLNQLRIFECVCRTRSMTLAAKELHMTQSGVSQHMKHLEEMLGVKLFDRINQRLVPTSSALLLFEKCAMGFAELERTVAHITGRDKELSGTVRIGMPPQFANSILMPFIAQFCVAHPHVNFRLELGLVSSMHTQIVQGDLDFAFVDSYTVEKALRHIKVYDEELALCVRPDVLKAHGPFEHDKTFYERLPYIDYLAGEPMLRMWFQHHLKSRQLNLNVRAYVMDCQSVGRFVVDGVGAAVLPDYVAQALRKSGHKLHFFQGIGKPLVNAISVAYYAERDQSPAVRAVLDYLLERLHKKS